ncbi:hypothetical protein [Pedococcus sp. 5OH_020]|uniref:hypothetical protein n=1 Tax=Pedococcus sp. 5OH_020 TaxID=2989814 RepID=UPI0022E9DE10|nr:hypothetical protein [Pedococcus sp. 5OH_020]
MSSAAQNPDHLIDPRWSQHLHAQTAGGPAQTSRPARGTDVEARLRAVIDPWERGVQDARSTLVALRKLADEVL